MKKTLLFSLMAVLLAGFGFGGVSLADGEISEIAITSTTTSVVEGLLPSYTATSDTEGISGIEEYGSNTTWLYHESFEGSSWKGWGLESKIAELGENHYGLRLKVETANGYSISSNATILFNGENWTNSGYTTIDPYSWGGYVIIDLGTATKAVAGVRGFSYSTLAGAIAAAQDGDTVILLDDVTLNANVGIAKSINIDLGGKTINANGNWFYFNGNVTSEISNGTINNTNLPAIQIQGGGNVTIKNGTYISESHSAVQVNGSNAEIVTGNFKGGFVAIGDYNNSNVTIKNGTFEGVEAAVHFQTKGSIDIENGIFKATDNCVLRTQGNEGQGGNIINVANGEFNGFIETDGYVACGIYVANDDTVTVNGGTFNIKDGVGIVSRGGTTTLGGDVSFNFSFGEKSFGDKGKVGDARIVVPAGYELVMDVAAGYPGATPTFVTINNLTGTYLVANTTPDYYVVSIKDGNTVVPLTLTKDGTTAKIAEAPQITEGYQWYNGEETGPYSFNSAITDNVTLTSRINQYTVSFNANAEGVTNPVSQEINHGEKAIEPEIENAGNILLGWFNGDDKFDFESPVTSNLELTAKWEAMTLSGGAKIDDETDEGTGMVVEADVPATETDASAVQSSNSTATVQGEVELNVYNDANGDGVKEGAPISDRVNFTKAVLVRIPVNSGSSVKIKVKHNGVGQTFGIDGLATASVDCNNGVASSNVYDGSARSVNSGYAEIWTCSASTFVAYTEVTNPTSSSSTSGGGSGGGGSSRTSALDDTKATTGNNAKLDGMKADETKLEENNDGDGAKTDPMIDVQAVEKFGQEQIDAYKWALENGITTMKTVEDARLDEPLTRAELAKMMVVYIQKVLEKSPVVTGDVNYPDVKVEEIGDLVDYVKLAYQYQIMGINADGTPIELFNPHGIVSRGEYATVFSRVLFGAKFNKEGADFYTNHLEALKSAGILTNTLPTIQEMRGWVMLMMYRSSQNGEAIEKVANSTEEIVDEAKAEEIVSEETVNVSDEEKSEGGIDTEETTKDSTEESVSDESSETPVNTAEATTGDALSE